MLMTIALKEFREHLVSARFALTVASLALIVAVTIVALAAEHRRQQDDYNRRVESHRREMQESGSMTVDRPAPALASLFKGQYFATQLALSKQNPPDAVESADIEATTTMFPAIDLGFCIGVVLSLVALLFSYDAITGEKESGTLKQILANEVSRAAIISAKWLALTATMSVLVVITLGFGVMLARFLPGSPFVIGSRDAGAILLIALTAMILLAAFSILGILVSSLVSSSSSSLAILMLVWVMLVFVFPNVSPYLAVWFSPAQTWQQAQRSEKQMSSSMLEDLKTRHAEGAQRVREEKLNAADMRKIASGIRSEWNSEHKEAVSRLRENYTSELHRQEKTAALIASFSPYSAATLAFAALSEIDARSDDRFLRLARIFDDDQLSAHLRLRAERPKDQRPPLPVFAYESASLGERLTAVAFQLSALISYNAVLFLASLWAFRRYDVR
ncbi:MAG: ABC transporter permease subunit [Acidobacteriota bacterium]